MENARRPDARFGLATLALVCVVAVVWAASALAGGSSSSSTSPPTGTDQPTAEYVQDGSGSAADENADRECPEGESGGAGSSSSASAAF